MPVITHASLGKAYRSKHYLTESEIVRSSRLLSIVAAAVLAVGLSACSSAETDSDAQLADAASGSAFPVTVEHVYGKTVIPEKPTRVATVAWANHEVPLALGVVPVGFSKVTWGDDDDNGVLPWVEESLTEQGVDISKLGDAKAAAAGTVPTLFDETDGIDFEAVADTAPDVILAAYSGLSREDYDTLSKIAPVIAYPDTPWGTSLEEMITLNSTALGMKTEGEALIEDLHGTIDAALEKHSAVKNAKVLFTHLEMTDLSQVNLYTSHDTRPGFLESIGLPTPSIVEEMTKGTDGFYVTVSAEHAEKFDDVDVFVGYGDDSTIEQLQADPLMSKIPAIAAGHVLVLEDNTPLAAAANPSPLSIEWAVDDYFGLIADAAAGK